MSLLEAKKYINLTGALHFLMFVSLIKRTWVEIFLFHCYVFEINALFKLKRRLLKASGL